MKLNNGAIPPMQLDFQFKGRIYPVTPDGSQWEVRVHVEGEITPGSPEIVGEVVFRSYNGGLPPLIGMAKESAKLTVALIQEFMEKAKKQAEDMQRAIMPATEGDLKNLGLAAPRKLSS